MTRRTWLCGVLLSAACGGGAGEGGRQSYLPQPPGGDGGELPGGDSVAEGEPLAAAPAEFSPARDGGRSEIVGLTRTRQRQLAALPVAADAADVRFASSAPATTDLDRPTELDLDWVADSLQTLLAPCGDD